MRRTEQPTLWKNSFQLAVIIMALFLMSSFMLRACQGDEHITGADLDRQIRQQAQNEEAKQRLGW